MDTSLIRRLSLPLLVAVIRLFLLPFALPVLLMHAAQLTTTQSRLAAHWVLNVEGQIEAVPDSFLEEDELLRSLGLQGSVSRFDSTGDSFDVTEGGYIPVLHSEEDVRGSKGFEEAFEEHEMNSWELDSGGGLVEFDHDVTSSMRSLVLMMKPRDVSIENLSNPLSCGPRTSNTLYDHLPGLQDRHSLPFQEDFTLLRVNQKINKSLANLQDVSLRLEEAISKERFPSTKRLIELGNYWRMQGNSLEAVECFRSALARRPNNPDALLSLARLLLKIGYWEDSSQLIEHSLSVIPSGRNCWLHYFTLAQMFLLSGQKEMAMNELSNALKLHPGFGPAVGLLKRLKPGEVVQMNTGQYQIYTLAIIFVLCVTVISILHRLLQKEAQFKGSKLSLAVCSCSCIKSTNGRGVFSHQTCGCASVLAKKSLEQASSKLCRCCQAARYNASHLSKHRRP